MVWGIEPMDTEICCFRSLNVYLVTEFWENSWARSLKVILAPKLTEISDLRSLMVYLEPKLKEIHRLG